MSVDATVASPVGSYVFDPPQIRHFQFAAEALDAVLAGAVRETLTKTHTEKHTLQFGPETAPEEGDEDMQVPQPPSLLVFSGGTAFNSVAGADIVQSNTESSSVVPACALFEIFVYIHTSYAQNSQQQCRNLAEFHHKGSACAACL